MKKENMEQMDLLSKLGLTDKDFEEPKDEEEKVEKKEEQIKEYYSQKSTENMMAKYYEEYDEDVETYERIKKGGKKNIMDNY